MYYTIENNVRLTGIPTFGEQRSAGGDAETWDLDLSIRHLARITSEELDEMTGFNPMTEVHRTDEQQEEGCSGSRDVPSIFTSI